METLPIIAITMGDPGGIGPEIILKSWGDGAIFNFCRPVVIGNANVFEWYSQKLQKDIKIVPVESVTSLPCSSSNVIYLLSVTECDGLKIGVPTKEGGHAAALCIKEAVTLALAGKVDALTTAPISKEGLNEAGYHYAGHTEMLADLTDTEHAVMMLAGADIRVALVTTHTGIKEVSSLLSKTKIETMLEIVHKSMFCFGIPSPKIAVTSLNPHAGEGGLFGTEEEESIAPAIQGARSKGIQVEGPFSADTLFVENKRKQFDAILAMYHDQGLIPLKMLAFGKSVNITLGLPVIRTSVDHGTAYDIVGQNKADPSSMKEAIRIASCMAGRKHDP